MRFPIFCLLFAIILYCISFSLMFLNITYSKVRLESNHAVFSISYFVAAVKTMRQFRKQVTLNISCCALLKNYSGRSGQKMIH